MSIDTLPPNIHTLDQATRDAMILDLRAKMKEKDANIKAEKAKLLDTEIRKSKREAELSEINRLLVKLKGEGALNDPAYINPYPEVLPPTIDDALTRGTDLNTILGVPEVAIPMKPLEVPMKLVDDKLLAIEDSLDEEDKKALIALHKAKGAGRSMADFMKDTIYEAMPGLVKGVKNIQNTVAWKFLRAGGAVLGLAVGTNWVSNSLEAKGMPESSLEIKTEAPAYMPAPVDSATTTKTETPLSSPAPLKATIDSTATTNIKTEVIESTKVEKKLLKIPEVQNNTVEDFLKEQAEIQKNVLEINNLSEYGKGIYSFEAFRRQRGIAIPYYIIEKSGDGKGFMFIFDKDNNLVGKVEVLYGEGKGEDPNIELRDMDDPSKKKYATTPYGCYNLTGRYVGKADKTEYEGRVVTLLSDMTKSQMKLRLHETYRGEFAKRDKLLKDQKGGNNAVTNGCLNVDQAVYDYYMSRYFTDMMRLYVTPEDQSIKFIPEMKTEAEIMEEELREDNIQ